MPSANESSSMARGPRGYRQLRVWQLAMNLAVESYRLTKKFPADERFGLTLQIRRAASSVSANIAEGYGRSHRGDYLRFLSIAAASLRETDSRFELAERLKMIGEKEYAALIEMLDHTAAMLARLQYSLARNRLK
jgi:four helix bundle protein